MGVERALILDFIFGRLRVIQSPTVSLKEGAVGRGKAEELSIRGTGGGGEGIPNTGCQERTISTCSAISPPWGPGTGLSTTLLLSGPSTSRQPLWGLSSSQGPHSMP